MYKSRTPPGDWGDLKKEFLKDFLPKNKQRYYRDQLSRRKQSSKEPVSQYILSKRLRCLEVNDKMTEKEIMSYVFEDILPEIKMELMIKDHKTLNKLCQSAQIVETALKILPSSEIRESDCDKTNRLLLDYMKMMDSKISELNQPKQ